MELFKKYIAPAIVASVVALLFFLLKASPAYKLWNGYTVLSVPIGSAQNVVADALEQAGCAQVISLQAQKSVSYSIYFPTFSFDDDYDKSKTLYFFDKDKRAELYYIPDANKGQAQKALSILNQKYNMGASLDSRQSFPLLVPLVVIAVFAAFFYFSENKIVFAISGVFGILFCFSHPYYSVAAADCLEFCAFYLAQKVWRRRGKIDFLLRNFYIWLFVLSSIFCAFAAGFVAGLLFILNLCASFCLLVLLFNAQLSYENRMRFKPVFIRSAKSVGAMTSISAMHTLFSACGIFILLVLFLTGVNFSAGKNAKDLYFPAPTEYNGQQSEFPVLEDFYAKRWNLLAAQYRSLNAPLQKPLQNEKLSITHYKKEGGKINSSEQVFYTYDEAFKKSVIDSLDNSAIERLWFEQGKDFSVAYTAGGGGVQEGVFSLFVLVFAMLLPLGAAFYYMLIWRRRNAF